MANLIVTVFFGFRQKIHEKKLVYYINSLVVSVSAVLGYDTMGNLLLTLYTLCLGQTCFYGCILLSAGDERRALPNARIMIHPTIGWDARSSSGL